MRRPGMFLVVGRAVALLSVAIVAGLFMLVLACGPVAPVVQGKVVEVGAGGNRIRVQDETRPDQDPIALDLSHAELGSRPVVGEVVRVVYRPEGDSNRALRVMNLSRQMGNQ